MVKAYFTACEQAFPAKRTQLRRLSLVLRRAEWSTWSSFAPYSGQDRKVVGNPINRGKEPAADCGGLRPDMKKIRHHHKGGAPLRQTGSCLTQECPTALGGRKIETKMEAATGACSCQWP